jgi:hypothetical protein
VIHESQGLAFGFKAAHHFSSVHTGFDQLDSHPASDRLLLLGKPDLSHATLPYYFEKMIGTDNSAGHRFTRRDRHCAKCFFAQRLKVKDRTSLASQ